MSSPMADPLRENDRREPVSNEWLTLRYVREILESRKLDGFRRKEEKVHRKSNQITSNIQKSLERNNINHSKSVSHEEKEGEVWNDL